MYAKDYVTIALAQNVLNGEQKPGTIMLRYEFDKMTKQPYLHGAYGDLTWALQRNYRCLDRYSDTQRVVLDGMFLTVWANGQRTSAHLTMMPGDNLAFGIATTYLTALQMCPHRNATEVYHTMRGDHEYTCNDCGATFGIDSSG